MKRKNIQRFSFVFIICTMIVITGCMGTKTSTTEENIEGNSNEAVYSNEKNIQTNEIDTDICKQFDMDFVASASGKTILSTSEQSGGGSYTCNYLLTEDKYGAAISITLSNLSVENQKKGAEMMDRTVSEDPRIKMDHFITTQEDGNINAVYLILGPEQFIRVDRNSVKALTNEEIIPFAAKVAESII